MRNRFSIVSSLYLAAVLCFSMMPSCSKSDKSSSEENHTHLHDDHDHEDHDHEHESHDHSGLIKFADDKAEEFGVKTAKISPSDFSEVILVSGRVESASSDEAIATATKSGILSLSSGVNVGTKVAASGVIGSVLPSALQGADPSLEAMAARDAAKRELDRLRPLHEDGVVSTQVYNNALANFEQAEASLKSSKQGSVSIMAPKAGVITQLLAKSGEYVEAGQKVAVINGNTNLMLRADVPEKYINRMAGIESANFRMCSTSDTFSLEELGGHIVSTPSSAMVSRGYLPIYFSFGNNGVIAPGGFAEVYLKSGVRHSVLSVPKDAIVEISGNKCVYSRHGEGLYEKHVVTLGASDGKRIEVISGLEPDEDIVTEGAQIIRMAETSATAVPGHTHHH